MTRAGPAAGPAIACERAHPLRAGITGGGRSHDQRQALGHPPSRRLNVVGEIEEVTEIRDEHLVRPYCRRLVGGHRGCPLRTASTRGPGRSLAAMNRWERIVLASEGATDRVPEIEEERR